MATSNEKNSSRLKRALKFVWRAWCAIVITWCVINLLLDTFGVYDYGFGPK